ncbi:MAG: hypothetical protein ACR2OE_01930 [Thermomicrobiales bacterium]
MTTRIYLATAKFVNADADPSDLPAERIFVNTSDVPEVWVETESSAVGEIGKVASFFIRRSMQIGFNRVTGTVERKIQK